MKDVEYPLRAGYVALLDGLTVGGKSIKVFDLVAPKPEETPYIIIDGIVPISNNTKDDFNSEVTVDLVIYTSYKGDFGGRKEADLIANAALRLVIPTPGKSGVSANGFNVYMAKLVSSNNELDYSVTKRTYRKRVTIEHFIQEL